ncbi:MAG: AAA family ATPase [Nostoc sp. S4]|nr:AAA family ATPase [Nostoc sp. S4]
MTKTTPTTVKNDKTASNCEERLGQLRQELNKIFLERSTVIDGVLAVLLTNSNAVLFGPPGCAKSWMLQELCRAIEAANFFDRLLQRAQPPEELLGQPSLVALQQQDSLIRNTKNRLPEAHIAFLDEIFRCNATTLNALLRLLNERVFENPEPQPVPLLFLCGAANDVPEDEELRAFVDRFVYRPWVSYVKKTASRRELIYRARNNVKLAVSTRLTLEEIKHLQAQAQTVLFPNPVVESLLQCQSALEREGFDISDRKLQQLVKLLQAHAYVQGDAEVYIESFHDLLPDCVWKKEPKERQKIAQILNQIIPDVNQQAVNWYDAAKEEVKKVQLAAKEYDLRPRNDTEKNLIETADSAAKHLEDVSRQIEKLLSQNQGKNVRRAKRMLTDIREDLMLEVAKYKEKVYS